MDDNEYLWMENINSKKVLAFIKEHNLRFSNLVSEVKEKLIDDVNKYFFVDQVSVIYGYVNGVYFVVNTGKQYKVLRHDDKCTIDEIISSGDMGKDIMIANIYPNWKGNILSVFLTRGSDKGVFKFIDVESREVIDEFSDYANQIFWIDDTRYLYAKFYRDAKTPDGIKPPTSRVFLREVASEKSEMIFGESVPTNYHITVTSDYLRRWLYLVVRKGWTATKIYVNRLDMTRDWELLYDAGNNFAFVTGYFNNSHLITVYDGEKLGRIVSVSDSSSSVYVETSHPICNSFVFKDKLFIIRSIHASDKVYLYDDGTLREIKLGLGIPISIGGIGWSSSKLYFVVVSFSLPSSLYVYDIDKDSSKPLYRYDVPTDVVVEEEFIESFDGKKVHIFIVKNPRVDKKVAIVHGYGGFGIIMNPMYLSYLLKFLEDGGVYVLANIRGGKEYGEKWHEEGMREKKFNVFKDYLSVLRWMKSRGYKVVGLGRSNGGLLVAATLNLDPSSMDLAIIGYPLLDMLRFHKLYIGRLWVTEYGDPDNPKDREYLKRYSPIHNIGDVKQYPPILVYTGLHDDRVHPSHAFRYVLKMSELGGNIYLRTDTESGHMGASPERRRDEYLEILSFIYKYLM